jgi:nucleoid-associated protein YgaU
MDYLEHITQDGERWDQLSQEYYTTPFEYERIIAANPRVLITPQLPGGLMLRIPLLDSQAPTVIPSEELPPWKR